MAFHMNRWLLALTILAMSTLACGVYHESAGDPQALINGVEATTSVPSRNQGDDTIQMTATIQPTAAPEWTPTYTPWVDLQASALPVSPVRGAIAPDFELDNLEGTRIFLRDFHGRFVVINFWATWCGPCLIELPYFQNSHEEYSPDLVILAINDNEPINEIQSYVDEIGITFRVLIDRGSKVQELYRVRGYPTTFFLDPDGIIQHIHIGLLTPTQLNRYLSDLGVMD